MRMAGCQSMCCHKCCVGLGRVGCDLAEQGVKMWLRLYGA